MHRFLYERNLEDSLKQGDILLNNDELLDILKNVHQYFANGSYTHFIILTQSCDLLKRSGQCKSRYITIAPIRPLAVVIQRELDNYQFDRLCKAAKISTTKQKSYLKDFLCKLYNNNYSEYFYLESFPSQTIHENSCAFLRLSISLKSEHYDACLRARQVSLTESFRAKLGWLVGNLYSRVGTPDWVPTAITEEQFSNKIETVLNEHCKWFDEEEIKDIKRILKKEKKYEDVIAMDTESAREYIETVQYKGKIDQTLEKIISTLSKISPDLEDTKMNALKLALKSDPTFKRLVAG